jgi:hypothetical protein
LWRFELLLDAGKMHHGMKCLQLGLCLSATTATRVLELAAQRKATVRVRPTRWRPLNKWIEDTIRLPVGQSAEPSPIQLGSHMIEIADAIGDQAVEQCLAP